MRVVFAVLLLFIAYVASYPSLREITSDDEDSSNDSELELRSILNDLKEEQMARSLTEEDDDDDDENDSLFDKRQSGHNVVGKQTKCELECVHAERHPKIGKGKTIKAAAKVCKNKCIIPSNKRGGKPITAHTVSKPTKKISVRDFTEDSDSNSSEEQQNQRRAFYDYLMEQVQRNNHE